MKQQTIEKILIMICVVGIILLAKGFVNKQMRIDEMKKAHVDSLERIALKVDSLQNIADKYDVQGYYWEVEINASGKEFTEYFERNFTKDSLEKVVIVATRNDDSLRWHIKAKNQ